MTFEQIKANFERGLWAEAQVRTCAKAGLITEEQAQAIIDGAPVPSTGDSSADVEQALENALNILKGVTD